MFRKELTYYFATPVAYVVIGLYLLAVSLFLWVIPGQWNIVESGYAQTDGLFQLSPWFLMLLCPALTMRLFAEERVSGTWNLLIAKKVAVWRIVVSKFLAAWTLTAIAILPCVVHFFLVSGIAEPVGNVDGAQFTGSMAGLLFLSLSFTAIGLVAVACFVLYWIAIQAHYESISRGVIDLRDVLFFLSIAAIGIILTILIIERITRK